jgi:hypothetical protein
MSLHIGTMYSTLYIIVTWSLGRVACKKKIINLNTSTNNKRTLLIYIIFYI